MALHSRPCFKIGECVAVGSEHPFKHAPYISYAFKLEKYPAEEDDK